MVVPGVTSELILKALKRVGWWEEDGKLVYRPMDVIDPRKFIKHHPKYTKQGLTLGSMELDPKFEQGKTRNSGSVRFYKLTVRYYCHGSVNTM